MGGRNRQRHAGEMFRVGVQLVSKPTKLAVNLLAKPCCRIRPRPRRRPIHRSNQKQGTFPNKPRFACMRVAHGLQAMKDNDDAVSVQALALAPPHSVLLQCLPAEDGPILSFGSCTKCERVHTMDTLDRGISRQARASRQCLMQDTIAGKRNPHCSCVVRRALANLAPVWRIEFHLEHEDQGRCQEIGGQMSSLISEICLS